jgi:methionyl-tRNA formyltransferase
MKKKKIIFLGSKPVGYKCLKILLEVSPHHNAIVSGILTKLRAEFKEKEDIISLAKKRRIKIIKSLDELLSIPNISFLVSVQYHKILKSEHINTAKKLAINLHMAPLPEYRGCNQFSFAILDKRKVFGTTIHKLEKGVDSGPIIAESRFKVPQNITVEDLYKKTEEESVRLFNKKIGNILDGNYKLTPQESLIDKRGTSTHYRKEIEDIKHIKLSWPREKIFRHLRATSMPGFEPPYTIINNKKVYLVLKENYNN